MPFMPNHDLHTFLTSQDKQGYDNEKFTDQSLVSEARLVGFACQVAEAMDFLVSFNVITNTMFLI